MNDDLDRLPDGELLDVVGAAYDDLPPVPEDLSQFARGVLDWAHVDARVAELMLDSGLELAAGLRSHQSNERVLTYVAEEVEIELTLMADAAVGRILPPGSYQVFVQTPAGRTALATDGNGRFRAAPLALPARLVVNADAGPVVTPWLVA